MDDSNVNETPPVPTAQGDGDPGTATPSGDAPSDAPTQDTIGEDHQD